MISEFHFLETTLSDGSKDFEIEMKLTQQMLFEFVFQGIITWLRMEIRKGVVTIESDKRTTVKIQVDEYKYQAFKKNLILAYLALNSN